MSAPATGGEHLGGGAKHAHLGGGKVGFVEVVEDSNGESRTTTSISGSDSPRLSPAKHKTDDTAASASAATPAGADNEEDAGDKRQRRRSLNLGKLTGFLISKKSDNNSKPGADDSIAANKAATTADLSSAQSQSHSQPSKPITFGSVTVGNAAAAAPKAHQPAEVTSPPLPMFVVGQMTPRARPQCSVAIAEKPGYWIENFDDSPPVPEGDAQVALFRIEDFNYHYHYGKYFFGNDHYNFTGVSDQVGPILVSIMKHPTYPAGYQAPADAPRSRPKSLSMANVKKFMSLRTKGARDEAENNPPMSPKPALERQTSTKKVTDTPLSPSQTHVERSSAAAAAAAGAHQAQSPPGSPSPSPSGPSVLSLNPSGSSPRTNTSLTASKDGGETVPAGSVSLEAPTESGPEWLAEALGKDGSSGAPVASLHDGFFRALVRYKTGDIALKIPVKSNKKHSAKELIEALKEMVSMMPEIPFDLASVQFKESHMPHQAILDMEHRLMPKGYKFGVMYAKQGQTTDDEILSNEEGSAAFETFLKQLGDRVELTGFTGYNGGLDVRHGSTGTHSVHTHFKDYEIMFHVATLLPYVEGDQQQLEKKRHIGNDVVVIVFQDGDTPFEPDLIKSFFNHVFVVVRPIKPGAGGPKLGSAGPSPFGNLARRSGDLSRAMPLVRKRSTSDLGKSEISTQDSPSASTSAGGAVSASSANSITASTETSESTEPHDVDETSSPRSTDSGTSERSKRLRRTMSQGIDKSVVRRVGILGPSSRGKPEMIRAESKDGLPRTTPPASSKKEAPTSSTSTSGSAKVATPASVAKSEMKKSSSRDHVPSEEEREKKEKKEREKKEKEREKEEKEKREKEEKERKEREKKEKKEQKERDKEKEKEKERERKAEKEREKEKEKEKKKDKEHKDKDKDKKDKDHHKDKDNKDSHATSPTKASDDEKRHSTESSHTKDKDKDKDTATPTTPESSEKKEKLKNQNKLANSRMRSASQAEVPRAINTEKRLSLEDGPAAAHTSSDSELAGSEDSNATPKDNKEAAVATPQRRKSVHRKPSGKMTVTSASTPNSPAEDRDASSGDAAKKHRSHRKSGRHTVLPVDPVNTSGAGTSSGSDTDATTGTAGALSLSSPRLPTIADDSDFEGNDHNPVVVGSSPRSFEDGTPLHTLHEEHEHDAASEVPDAVSPASPSSPETEHPPQPEERKSPKKPDVVPVLPVAEIPPPVVVEPVAEQPAPAPAPAPDTTTSIDAAVQHPLPIPDLSASEGAQNDSSSHPVSPHHHQQQQQLLGVPHLESETGSFSAAPQRKRSKQRMETYVPAVQSIASPRDIDVSAALTWLNPEPEPLEPIPARPISPAKPAATGAEGEDATKPTDATSSDAVTSEAAAPATADAASQPAGEGTAAGGASGEATGEGGGRRGNGQAMRSLFRKKSQFMVKQETTIRSFLRYRVEIVSKDGVAQSEQILPNPPIFHHGPYFKEFLLTKLINSERASYFAPQFARPLERTRQILLENLFRDHNK